MANITYGHGIHETNNQQYFIERQKILNISLLELMLRPVCVLVSRMVIVILKAMVYQIIRAFCYR